MKVKRKTICQTCRKGKIGCDGKQPACTQCVFRGLSCPGYPSDWTFVPQGCTVGGHRSGRERPSLTAAVKGNHRPRLDLQERPGLGEAASSAVPRPLTAPLDDLMMFVVRSFVPDANLGPGRGGGIVPPTRVCGSWVEVLPALASSGNNIALSSAINAFALAMMSGATPSTSMVSSAGETYTQALCALHSELRSAPKSKALPSQIIASIMCLLFAELFQPTSLGSWMAHLRGFGESMQLAKPKFFASGIPHRFFAGARPILIVLGFITRRTTFLAAEEWKHDPFVETPASPMQKLMSDASVIPTILETLDGLATRPRELAVVAAGNCVRQLVDVVGSLGRWKATSPTTRAPLFGCTAISKGDVPCLWFPSITDANEATHFWAFNALCLATISQVAVSYPEVGVELQSLAAWTTEDRIFQETIKLSKRICHSMDYQMQAEMRLYGVSSILLPLRVAYDVFSAGGARTAKELAFCRSILTRTVAMGHQFVPMFFDASRR